jgi:hypothetical protein
MNIEFVGVIIWSLILVAVIIYLVREVLILGRQTARKTEMRHHVKAITKGTVDGCEFAERHYNEALHIMEHYGVRLDKVGFRGSLKDFHLAACASLKAYIRIFRGRIMDEWGAYVEPDEMGFIGVPSIEGSDAFNSVQLYAQARRRLKRLERQYRIFRSSAPPGARFLLHITHFSAMLLILQ